MNKKILLTFIAILASILPFQQAAAQTTHARSAHRQWKGMDVEAYLEGSSYGAKPVIGTTPMTKVYLYNVGTGCFLIEGGNYGIEGRLFHERFGRPLDLMKTGHFYTHMTEDNPNLQFLICNVPGVTKGSAWKNYNTYTFTTVMDGNWSHDGKRESHWHFVRVEEDPSSEYYTYYMYQTHTNKQYQGSYKNYYFGAAYGEWCSDGATNSKGNGYYVYLDFDRACWTTAGQSPSTCGGDNEIAPYLNTTKVRVDSDMVAINELYQWRVVSEEEFNHVIEDEETGLNPSVSNLIPDRDFSRNANDFYPNWLTSPAPYTPSSGEGRYGYTWGFYAKGQNQTERYETVNNSTVTYKDTLLRDDESWDSPVRLKQQFNDIDNAKYGYLSFEGKGMVSTTFTVPRGGWYMIEASAISFGNPSYMFAMAGGKTMTFAEMDASNSNSPHEGFGKVTLEHTTAQELKSRYSADITFPSDTTKHNKDYNIAIGKVLTKKAADHRRNFWIYIDPVKYDSADVCKTITIGFRKDTVTKSSTPLTVNGINYYYDTDWVCADDIKMSYMGLNPTYLYDNQESFAYLGAGQSSFSNRFNGSLTLGRILNKNQWNAFSMPIPLTGEQVRYAFGEGAELLEIAGIGTLSMNPNVIDFRHVQLKPTNPDSIIVVPGKFYLLKPTIDPTAGKDPEDNLTYFYQLGRNFFSIKPGGEDASYEHYWMDTTKLGNHYPIESFGGENDGVAYVNYVQTKNYNTFSVNSSGIYTGLTPDTLYVPGSNGRTYAVSGGTICELNRDMRIKGLRGWITLSRSIFDDSETPEPTSGLRMSIDGIVDGEETTGIAEQLVFPVSLPEDTNVYDLFGRRVGTLGMQLPKGIYIVKGKKFYVR